MVVTVHPVILCVHFFFTEPATTEIYTLSLHDALPISKLARGHGVAVMVAQTPDWAADQSADCPSGISQLWRPPPGKRSEEHTSELQSRRDLVCRLLLEKKKKIYKLTRQNLQNNITIRI